MPLAVIHLRKPPRSTSNPDVGPGMLEGPSRPACSRRCALLEDDLFDFIDPILAKLGLAEEEGEEYREPPLDVLRYYRRPVKLHWLPMVGRAHAVVAVVRQPVDVGIADYKPFLARVAMAVSGRFPPSRKHGLGRQGDRVLARNEVGGGRRSQGAQSFRDSRWGRREQHVVDGDRVRHAAFADGRLVRRDAMTRAPLVALLVAGCTGSGVTRDYGITTGGDAHRGQALVQDRYCGACHAIPDVVGAHGVIGPSLEGFAARSLISGSDMPNTPDNIVRWIMNPPAVNPRTAMPSVGLNETQARDVAAYLYTLR